VIDDDASACHCCSDERHLQYRIALRIETAGLEVDNSNPKRDRITVGHHRTLGVG